MSRDPVAPSTGSAANDAMMIALASKAVAEGAQRSIDAHEDLCAERYDNIHKTMAEMKTELKESVGGIWKLFGWAGGTALTIVLALLGFLLKAQFDMIQEMSKASYQRAELIERTQPQPPQVIIQRAPGQPDMGATVERR